MVGIPGGLLTLSLCGDVMTGRGVDQILPHGGDPRLREMRVRDARTYIELAEEVNGAIPRPVDHAWPWGDALTALAEVGPDVRIVNLETSITRSDEAAAGKAVHYRMTPENVGCLAVARPDVCTLANNHVLDFGQQGLVDTRQALATVDIFAPGAGRNAGEAQQPAAVPVGGGGRVLVYACGTQSSGIPPAWAATAQRPGVNLLPDLSVAAADQVAERLWQERRPGDLTVVSIHWGSNWGYEIPSDQVRFAHRLIDRGVDVVHGHSSHHPRPIQVYRGKLILYGCGNFIDDYEGISGFERYRDDLRLLYLASLEPETGRLVRLRMLPLQSRQMRLRRATREDVDYLNGVLNGISHRFGSRVAHSTGGMLQLDTGRG